MQIVPVADDSRLMMDASKDGRYYETIIRMEMDRLTTAKLM